ncbi:hypothetical protein [Hyalangium versicolor]|uniref:hypothetical protein n=1 Tax=Hyalangium versicolor TaxID=2861190 RepID=UPI001CCACCDA|nr:hypothetical protein [Hyalangium versicolor]
MSARKPQRGGTGRGTAKAKTKAKTARPKQKTPKASSKASAKTPAKTPVKTRAKAAPEPLPPPIVNSPTGAPLAFGSRVSEMPPAAQVRSVEASAMRGMMARQGFRSVMSLEPAPPVETPTTAKSAGANVVDKERQRLSALRKETAKRPVATVRPDYFGTAEHRASAEQLARMLAGEGVFSRATVKPTHALLRVATPNPVPDAVLERSSLSVASADPAWREPFQNRLEDLMARYRPLTELEIRPGLTLTYGEVVALAGDYYATPEELASELTPSVAEAIRGVTPQDEGTFLLNTHRGWFDYAMLANENQDHFSPRNWARYARHHAEALQLALDRDLDAALVRNAFADHFLTDAFASGHLRVPRDGLVGLSGALPTRKMHDEENVQGLWVQSASGFVWRAYGDDQLGTNPVHLTLTAFAVGLSLLRLFKAYRLEGAERDELIDAIGEAPQLDLTAGQLVDPRTLPRFLGDIAGLPGILEHLPVPLGSLDEPDTANVLANYPPQVALGGKRRKGTPDFEAYFRFE